MIHDVRDNIGFCHWFSRLVANCHDDAAKLVRLLSKPGCPYLVAEDLIPLIQDVVDTHPGLTFLQDAPEFHSRYVHTVSTLCLSVCLSVCLIPLIQDVMDTHPGVTFLQDASDTRSLWVFQFLKLLKLDSCFYLNYIAGLRYWCGLKLGLLYCAEIVDPIPNPCNVNIFLHSTIYPSGMGSISLSPSLEMYFSHYNNWKCKKVLVVTEYFNIAGNHLVPRNLFTVTECSF